MVLHEKQNKSEKVTVLSFSFSTFPPLLLTSSLHIAQPLLIVIISSSRSTTRLQPSLVTTHSITCIYWMVYYPHIKNHVSLPLTLTSLCINCISAPSWRDPDTPSASAAWVDIVRDKVLLACLHCIHAPGFPSIFGHNREQSSRLFQLLALLGFGKLFRLMFGSCFHRIIVRTGTSAASYLMHVSVHL